MSVRTRFAPSPTGFLHIGGVRTALFNWLFARNQGGAFILRIDDTDQDRHVEEAVRLILDGFRWMGIDWDEGPEVGGPRGPYFQSQRAELHRAALRKLVDAGLVYRDYSTEEQRAAERRAAEEARRPYRFRGTPPSDDEARALDAAGQPHALRFRVPPGRVLVLEDIIKGTVEQRTDDMGDFVVARQDGTPLYNFASAVDDLDMGVTHVIRAEEHLTNTFAQLLVIEALADGRTPPRFAHVPYVAEPGSKKKLSKRHGAVGLDHYIELGYLPEAMLNYLARLGWSHDATTEIFSRDELIEKFSLDRVNSSPASHDPDKLHWLQGEWMKTLDVPRKVEGALPHLQRAGLAPENPDEALRARVAAVVVALEDRLKVFSDIVKLGGFFFTENLVHDPDAVRKRLRKEPAPDTLRGLREVLREIEPFETTALEAAVHEFAQRRSLKMGDVVNPLRVAVTGQAVGPGLYDCLAILGRESCLRRIDQTLDMLAATPDGP